MPSPRGALPRGGFIGGNESAFVSLTPIFIASLINLFDKSLLCLVTDVSHALIELMCSFSDNIAV